MSSEINSINSGSIYTRTAAAPTQSAATPKADAAPAIKPAPKLELPVKAKLSFDPAKSSQSVKEAVSLLNEQLSAGSTGIGFIVREDGGTPIVTVRNNKTGEVVRQIPNEVVLKIAQNVDSFKGTLADKKT